MKDFEQFYTEYLSYKALYGTNKIPTRYFAAGYPLGQRACALRNGGAKVTQEQKEKLDEADFLWRVQTRANQCPFDRFYAELDKYQKTYGTLKVPKSYVTEDGIRLGILVKSFKYGMRMLTPSQKNKLLAMGFSFEKHFYRSYTFSEVILALQKYYDTHDSHFIPLRYVDEDDCPLGRIAYDIRRGQRKTTKLQKKSLDEIGFCWVGEKKEYSFDEKIRLLKEYKDKYGDTNVPQKYFTEEGVPLGEIVHLLRQRACIPKKDLDALNELGFVWKNNERRTYTFEHFFSMLQEFREEYGNFDIPIAYKTKEGNALGTINYGIRTGHRKLSDEQKEQLKKIGYIF